MSCMQIKHNMRINIYLLSIMLCTYNFSHSHYCHNTKAEYTVIYIYCMSYTRMYYIVIMIEQLKNNSETRRWGTECEIWTGKTQTVVRYMSRSYLQPKSVYLQKKIIFMIQSVYIKFNTFNKLRHNNWMHQLKLIQKPS